jgi:hypothetical protein
MRLNATRLGSIASSRSFGDQLDDLAGQVPGLDLNFAQNKSLIDDYSGTTLVTFTRASSGTFVGSDGLIKTAATNEPRFDHNPTTGESLGLLVEEARTNVLTWSEDFSNAVWTSAAATPLSNTATAPDGALTADSYTATAVSGEHRIFRASNVTVTASSTITFSVFVKASGITRLRLNIYNSPSRTKEIVANVNLSTGTIALPTAGGGYTAVASSIQPYPNSFYRISITGTVDAATTSVLCDLGLQNSAGNSTWTPVGTETLIVWGAQLEAGAFPTSYVPTTSATVTRAADVASITGSSFSSWYNQTEGTLYGETQRLGDSIGYIAALSDGTDTNRIAQFRSTTTLGSRLTRAGTATNPGDVTTASLTLVRSVIAAKAGDAVAAGNGTLGSVVSPIALPTVSQLNIALGGASSFPLNGTIKRLTYWPTRLANTTLQQITQP